MESGLRPLCLALLVAIFVELIQSDEVNITPLPVGIGSCSELKLTDFGSTSEFTSSGILPVLFITGDGTGPPMLMVKNFHIVCKSIGQKRDAVGSISAVIEYILLDSSPTLLTAQVTLDCQLEPSISTFFPAQTGSDLDTTESRGRKLLTVPNANINTPLAPRCGICVDPTGRPTIDNTTHCGACDDACSVGMMKCTSSSGAAFCCNWFFNEDCVAACPTQLVGNPSTFNCECKNLVIDNGRVEYENRNLPGSSATFICNNGYDLDNSEKRLCSKDGWSNNNPTCILKDCGKGDLANPKNGTVDYKTTTFKSVATFRCDEGFILQGEAERTCLGESWSLSNPTCERDTTKIECKNCNGGICDLGVCICPAQVVETNELDCIGGGQSPSTGGACGTSCIIGVLMAVIGIIILAATISGVAFGIYNYMNHPDTKMAKYDADNINGVARDNPLYVDPEAVVGDGAEAA